MLDSRKSHFFSLIRRNGFLVLCCAILTTLQGCGGYRFAGSKEHRLASHQSLWVSFISNDTVSPTAQTVIRRAILEASHNQRGMKPAISQADARIVVNGNLRSYSSTAVSYTAADRVREYRLLIAVELEVHRSGDKLPLWKGTIQAFQDFPAADDLALQRNAEEAALSAASVKLAQRLLAAVEQSY